MSAEFNKAKTTGVTGSYNGSVIGRKEPLPHPVNCQNECPYGYGRAFCFPCYKKIMSEHNAAKKQAVKQGE